MNVREEIARHLLQVHEGGNWTEVSVRETLADVTPAEATRHTAGSPNTIAALLRHLTFWNRVMARRAQGQPTAIGPANGFDGPDPATEADWQTLQADNLRSAQELAAAIRAVPAERLAEPILAGYSTAYYNLQGAVEHVHYHLGQLVILKHLVRAQV